MKVLTANRLTDGEAVWWSEEGGWIEQLPGAAVIDGKDDEARLEAVGAQGIRDNLVVDVNLIDVALQDGRPVPTRLRERIRATGPTNHLDHGKQSEA